MYRTFNDDLAIGKRGEQKVMSALDKRGHSVTDVSDKLEYQLKDIDIIISKNGDSATLEIKNDLASCRTGNVFVEIRNTSNVKRGGDGWINYTEADYLCFVQEEKKIAHIVSRDELIRKCWNNEYRTANGFNTVGYIVPIWKLKQYRSYYCLLLEDDAEC